MSRKIVLTRYDTTDAVGQLKFNRDVSKLADAGFDFVESHEAIVQQLGGPLGLEQRIWTTVIFEVPEHLTDEALELLK